MNLRKAWAVTTNDFSVFRRKTYIFYSLVALPVALSIGLPLTVWLLIQRNGISLREVEVLLNAFSFVFILLPSLLPTVIASYSFVGEKLEKSLEPLLATPATDGELLLGKSMAAFLPSLLTTYLGAGIFMALADELTYGRIGSYYFPNWNTVVILLVAVPLACAFSVQANVIIASLVNDLRTAQQLGVRVLIPVGVLYVLAENNFLSLDVDKLLIISAFILVADLGLVFLCRAAFRREEILTKWA
jgi:ABC-2 type transport system permease protein